MVQSDEIKKLTAAVSSMCTTLWSYRLRKYVEVDMHLLKKPANDKTVAEVDEAVFLFIAACRYDASPKRQILLCLGNVYWRRLRQEIPT